MAEQLTIAFAYGASDVSATHAETLFRRHLPGTWIWAARGLGADLTA
jgi:hypothetical protein